MLRLGSRHILACQNALAKVPVAAVHSSAMLLRDVLVSVPKMGDSITEGTLIKVAKQVGEGVALDEIVAVIETDKVRDNAQRV